MIKHIDFDDYGYMAGTSLSGTYQTLLTMTDDADVLMVFNTCDNAIILQIPAKGERATTTTTKEIRIPKKVSFTLDGRINSKRFLKGTIKVKHAGSAVTAGEVTVTVCR